MSISMLLGFPFQANDYYPQLKGWKDVTNWKIKVFLIYWWGLMEDFLETMAFLQIFFGVYVLAEALFTSLQVWIVLGIF